MKKLRIGLFLLLSLCMMLSGCRMAAESHKSALNLTKSIQIDCHYRGIHLQRIYQDPDKIDVILRYLHRLSPLGQCPQQARQDTYDDCRITVQLLNGSARDYYLYEKDYLCKSNGDWYCVDPEKANVLYHLVNHIESDEETARQHFSLACRKFL